MSKIELVTTTMLGNDRHKLYDVYCDCGNRVRNYDFEFESFAKIIDCKCGRTINVRLPKN